MTLWSKATAAAWAVILCAGPAQADVTVTVLMRAGAWQAVRATTRSGIPLCGAEQQVNGRYFGLKVFAEKPFFSLQLGSHEWAEVVVDRSITPTTLRFDSNLPWTTDGVGMHFEDGAGALQLNFDRNAMADFVTQFRNGNRLVVTFRNPAMAEWLVHLNGTNAVSEAFLGCANKLRKPAAD